ncbi:hypothetical protein [Pseudonocardia humida]|uniref:Uncharacterized protein n=1 Tax=Pseudonocardia humida TaxID=2800819 RepID=A0ABT0ZT62_9PSEU|nr:hypothetical protein [Pseudonocardia humida]MCO1653921.1 hypothetical protein [Pseudonocardia humida]
MSAVPTEFTADIPDGRDPPGDPASGRVRMPVPVPATVPVPPSAPPVAATDERRIVAVALSAEELLRPGSDLTRILRGFPSADLLVATDEPRLTPVRIPLPPPVHVDDLPPVELDQHAAAEQELELPTSVVIDDLDVPGLRVHRLALDLPLPGHAEDDLVAALSELIGFDPEPGVVCLAPAAGGGAAVAGRAAQRVARVYGLPLLRFGSRDLCGAVVTS